MIAANGLSIGFAGLSLVENLTFEVPAGGVLALIGASGSGKTTLLRALAGLHPAARGRVEILGESPTRLYGSGKLQFLHQVPALWKHLTAWDHVRLGLEFVREPVRPQRIAGILEQVGLHGSERKYPREMSRGMQARLALARAFAAPPEVLLMDEPFAGLDPLRREQLNQYVRSLRDDAHCTIVMVTHDVVEAMRFATQFLIFPHGSAEVVVMKNRLRKPIADPNGLNADEMALRDEIVDMIRTRPRVDAT